MELTSRQRTVLSALINGYQSMERPITGEEIAEAVDRHPGTIRNQTQSLKALDLIESIPGPGGGYKPTVNAFEALDRQTLDESETLILVHGYDRIGVTVDGIDFIDVHHPEECRARVSLQQSAARFSAGTPVVVGPTPRSRLVLAGEVEAFDAAANELRLDVTRLEAPADAEAETSG